MTLKPKKVKYMRLEDKNQDVIFYHLCNFIVRDIKKGVHLESSHKINFNLVKDYFSKMNF